MDQEKTGQLIRRLRLEKGMTQQALAEKLTVQAKTVSKWETGRGCPDTGLLAELAGTLGVETAALLSGVLPLREKEAGMMKKTQFYRCPDCGSICMVTGGCTPVCCGRPLTPLAANKAEEAHAFRAELVDDEWFVTFDHPMEKDHHIAFVAEVGWDRALLVRLYPEQGGEVRLPRLPGGKILLCCTEHGLFTAGK